MIDLPHDGQPAQTPWIFSGAVQQVDADDRDFFRKRIRSAIATYHPVAKRSGRNTNAYRLIHTDGAKLSPKTGFTPLLARFAYHLKKKGETSRRFP